MRKFYCSDAAILRSPDGLKEKYFHDRKSRRMRAEWKIANVCAGRDEIVPAVPDACARNDVSPLHLREKI